MGQEREESQGFFEMLWDCEFCDARGLLGKTQRYCANCGGPQNPAKRYFPPEGEQRRVDGHLYEGADRTCPACSAPQSARTRNCTHCGSVLDDAAEVRGVVDAAAARPAPARPRRGRKIWAFLVAAVALIGVVIWWRCRTQEAQVTVAGHAWERTVAIEEFNDYPESAWRDQVPAGAGSLDCHEERERSKRKIADGEECTTERRDKKDGTFEQVKKCTPKYRSEPVMDTWCRFTVRRWKPAREANASGTGLSPAWPANLPPATAPASLGARRQGQRAEKLLLDFGGRGRCEVKEPVWRKYTDGQTIKATVRASSGDVVCSSL